MPDIGTTDHLNVIAKKHTTSPQKNVPNNKRQEAATMHVQACDVSYPFGKFFQTVLRMCVVNLHDMEEIRERKTNNS